MKIERTVTIVNKLGLHARAATQLVQVANRFSARITVSKGGQVADANSVLCLMMLGSSQGEQVLVCCEGEDAEPAMQAVTQLITERFNENE